MTLTFRLQMLAGEGRGITVTNSGCKRLVAKFRPAWMKMQVHNCSVRDRAYKSLKLTLRSCLNDITRFTHSLINSQPYTPDYKTRSSLGWHSRMAYSIRTAPVTAISDHFHFPIAVTLTGLRGVWSQFVPYEEVGSRLELPLEQAHGADPEKPER